MEKKNILTVFPIIEYLIGTYAMFLLFHNGSMIEVILFLNLGRTRKHIAKRSRRESMSFFISEKQSCFFHKNLTMDVENAKFQICNTH